MGMRHQNKIFAVFFSLNNCLVTFPHFDNPSGKLRFPPWADTTAATEIKYQEVVGDARLFYQCQPQNLEPIKTKPMHTEPMTMPQRPCRSMERNCSYSWSKRGRPTTFLRWSILRPGWPPFQFLAMKFNSDQRSGRLFLSQFASLEAFRDSRMLHT